MEFPNAGDIVRSNIVERWGYIWDSELSRKRRTPLEQIHNIGRPTRQEILNEADTLTGGRVTQRGGTAWSDGLKCLDARAALGSVLTNKYSEDYPGRRYYGGQQYTDVVENIARDRACALFRAEHAKVQPLSGSPMNQACYFTFLNPGDTVLAMDLSHGGHLTH